MPRAAITVAVLLVIVHAVFGALLTISDTGPDVGLSDQIGIALIGVVEAGAVLLLTRARLRVGPSGIAVRNLVSERIFGWDEIGGLVYPEGKFCARLLLPSDEYVPVLAVQARDGDRAVAAMENVRDAEQRYGRSTS
ncbi:PH domain-containing protein [Gordonia sp. TBRC 11910]|uniref:PH domain-containing protein n=1 Tax=Gordonia asplenii TaxID=2725283 RepID=A0A848KYE2_9ACTN|nr:PH domain-containing protein [Gordonia asplenii]NMO00458.1 PH domain-containing protein [Gordonia asplenii]